MLWSIGSSILSSSGSLMFFVCLLQQFEANVYEGSTGVVVNLTVDDRDDPDTGAGRAIYSIINGDPTLSFEIQTNPDNNEGMLSVIKVKYCISNCPIHSFDDMITISLHPQWFSPFSLWTMRPKGSTRYSSKWRMRTLWFLMLATAPAPLPLSASQSWTSTRAPYSSPTPWQSTRWKTFLWEASWLHSTPQIQIYYRHRASGKEPWSWVIVRLFKIQKITR